MRHTSLLLAVLALAGSLALRPARALAIESSEGPVKVTQKNSGPSYEVEVKRDDRDEAAGAQGRVPTNEAEPTPVGHFLVRRIFMVPVMRPDADGERAGDADSSAQLGMRPLWPFMMPPVAPAEREANSADERAASTRHQHLFGTDHASRSPAGAESEREREEAARREQLLFDPIKMTLDLMHQVFNERLSPAAKSGDAGELGQPGDLNKEASGEQEAGRGLERRPQTRSHNETKEEVVEIEGKKYLKKSVINKHVGDNIIFMTRRLIFVPLNETTESGERVSTSAPAASTDPSAPATEAVSSSTLAPQAAEPSTPVEEPKLPATEPPASTARATEETTTTSSGSSSTERVSLLERVGEAIDKAAERLVDAAKEQVTSSSTTEKPASAA